MSPDGERRARVALSFLAQPGDPVLGAALRTRTANGLLALVTGADVGGEAMLAGEVEDAALARALPRWRERLSEIPSTGRLAAWRGSGLRVIQPGDAEWPTQLDDLGDTRPLQLWVRGTADIRLSCVNSVSIVGSRAATGYGNHVAIEMAAHLAERGVAVVSGGAYGIDAAAHRGALAASGVTVAVLAGGLEFGYPRGHGDLFGAIAAAGALVSECPPDRGPTRPGFLVRNRIIAALSRGTVVVEAALRSGALNSARHARELCRPVMAVPGPVTSEQSAGCHELIRDYGAMCVTCGSDVAEHIALPGAGPSDGPRRGLATARDMLDPASVAVLEEVPVRGGRGPASIAVRAGVDLDTALRCLGVLAAGGFVERCELGWRAARLD
ncbi:MAG TPA: DNA-processing protein DprA [Streptosporangiaceae bacterium]|jgi:DNA processing protein|nr:DNA-processing protein DprA [Streptosporangiaceae bacterium]